MSQNGTKKIQTGLEKYQYLRQRLFAVNVSTDRDFQRAFNGFFRMSRRSEQFYTDFYNYLEQHKHAGISFSNALTFLYKKHGRLEMSFTSKMVALVDPSYPIWDSVVTKGHFGIVAPYSTEKNRLQKGIDKYAFYCQQYSTYLKSEAAQKKVSLFDTLFPGTEISDVKKLDFILWQDR